MKLHITTQEWFCLAELVEKAREQAETAHKETPNRLFQLRRDSMTELESKIIAAIQREISTGRSGG